MSYLAYDRERLTDLRRAIRRASDQLAALRSVDPEAIDAVHALAASRIALDDTWVPVLNGLLSCTALDGRNPVRLDLTDLRLASMVDRQQSGWQITTDPVNDVTPLPITVDEARAIGRRLLDEHEFDELTSEELLWLGERLDLIDADQRATKAFRSAFDGDGDWAALLDRLGLDRAHQTDRAAWNADDRDARDRIAQLDAVVAPLARIYTAGPHTSHAGPWFPTVIDRLDPYAAALLLRQLDLDPWVAARAADEVLVRWTSGHDGDRRWIDPLSACSNAADLLFGWLATDAAAARLFVLGAAKHPEMLFLTTNADDSIVAVLAAATDPSVMSVADGGRTIRPLLEWTATHDVSLNPTIDTGADDIRSVMAAVLGPWLMQFTSRSADWHWSQSDGDHSLRWVIEDDDAAAQLVVAMGGWQRVLAMTQLIDADGQVDDAAIEDLAGLFGRLQVALHDEERKDAAIAGFWSDNTAMFGAILLTELVPGGMVISVLADLTFSVLAPVAQTWLEEHDVLHGSGDDKDAADARFASRSSQTQLIAVVAVVGQLIEAGKLPADALDGLRVDGLHEFIQTLDGSIDAVTYNALVVMTDAFGNALSKAMQT